MVNNKALCTFKTLEAVSLKIFGLSALTTKKVGVYTWQCHGNPKSVKISGPLSSRVFLLVFLLAPFAPHTRVQGLGFRV